MPSNTKPKPNFDVEADRIISELKGKGFDLKGIRKINHKVYVKVKDSMKAAAPKTA